MNIFCVISICLFNSEELFLSSSKLCLFMRYPIGYLIGHTSSWLLAQLGAGPLFISASATFLTQHLERMYARPQHVKMLIIPLTNPVEQT